MDNQASLGVWLKSQDNVSPPFALTKGLFSYTRAPMIAYSAE